jgi:hypothetical protein
MTDPKDLRNKYGITMSPIPCTSAYKRKMPFDHKTVKTVSWILVDDTATTCPDGKGGAIECEGTRTHVNTYNGETKAGYDANKATFVRGDEKELKKKLKTGRDDGYTPCEINECPVAVRAFISDPIPGVIEISN